LTGGDVGSRRPGGDGAGQRVSKVEYYPVYHGILGFGQLFLFYDEDRRLASFYRKQIN
jgi:hypothetical protein